MDQTFVYVCGSSWRESLAIPIPFYPVIIPPRKLHTGERNDRPTGWRTLIYILKNQKHCRKRPNISNGQIIDKCVVNYTLIAKDFVNIFASLAHFFILHQKG